MSNERNYRVWNQIKGHVAAHLSEIRPGETPADAIERLYLLAIQPTPTEHVPYNKLDHTHCWKEKNPPCGIKGEHRCYLCEEPVQTSNKESHVISSDDKSQEVGWEKEEELNGSDSRTRYRSIEDILIKAQHHGYDVGIGNPSNPPGLVMKDFRPEMAMAISTLLVSKEKELLERVEKVKRCTPSEYDDSMYPEYVDGYNKGISEVQKLITTVFNEKGV